MTRQTHHYPRRLSHFLIAATLASTLALPSLAQKITPNIPYTTTSQPQETGDLYQPAGTGPFPAIVFLHGGSWRSGNKGDFRKLATGLAAKGYAGFSIDYDLHPHSFPLSWQQAEAAVRFVRTHAAEYHIDPNQIVIAGTSAGGELAALVALAPNGPATSPTQPATPPNDPADTVAAAIILNGVFDLNSSAHVITRYLGGDCQSIQPACQDASPQQHIHPGAPPFFIGHGTSDHTVPYAEAQAFATSLRTDHVPVTFYTAPNGPHMYWTRNAFYAANLAAIEAFLASTLHSEPTLLR